MERDRRINQLATSIEKQEQQMKRQDEAIEKLDNQLKQASELALIP
jgi:uncharacterized protein (DUF3084 family)